MAVASKHVDDVVVDAVASFRTPLPDYRKANNTISANVALHPTKLSIPLFTIHDAATFQIFVCLAGMLPKRISLIVEKTFWGMFSAWLIDFRHRWSLDNALMVSHSKVRNTELIGNVKNTCSA